MKELAVLTERPCVSSKLGQMIPVPADHTAAAQHEELKTEAE